VITKADMPADPVDRRVYVEYLVWLAFTAGPVPYEDPRHLRALTYFKRAGYKT
jgi:hypothetical protein